MNRFDLPFFRDDSKNGQETGTELGAASSGQAFPKSAADLSDEPTRHETCDSEWLQAEAVSSVRRPTGNLSHAAVTHRSFLLPVHYESRYQYPLLVWLHSDGYNERQIEHVLPHISLRNFVAVGVRGVRAVDAAGHRFDWPTSASAVATAQETVAEAIAEAHARFSVHPARVVLAGYQSGGSMAMRVALRDPEAFAGAISLGGNFPCGGSPFGDLEALRRRRLPMLWQWARRNPSFRHDQLAAEIRSAMMIRAQVEIRQYDDDDEMNTVSLADVNDWLMSRIVAGIESARSDRWASTDVPFSCN